MENKIKTIQPMPTVLNPVVSNKNKGARKPKKSGHPLLYFAVSILLLGAYSFAFLYPEATFFLEAPQKLAALQEEVQQYKEATLPDLMEIQSLKKAAFEEELGQVESTIDRVFPTFSDKLSVVKRLENFATALHAKSPPFEFNSITFGKETVTDEYTILPISTSIHSSRANFDRFLELINLSGKLDSQIPIRLMEISNISVRYRGVDKKTGQDRGVDFSVKLNAYSR